MKGKKLITPLLPFSSRGIEMEMTVVSSDHPEERQRHVDATLSLLDTHELERESTILSPANPQQRASESNILPPLERVVGRDRGSSGEEDETHWTDMVEQWAERIRNDRFPQPDDGDHDGHNDIDNEDDESYSANDVCDEDQAEGSILGIDSGGLALSTPLFIDELEQSEYSSHHSLSSRTRNQQFIPRAPLPDLHPRPSDSSLAQSSLSFSTSPVFSSISENEDPQLLTSSHLSTSFLEVPEGSVLETANVETVTSMNLTQEQLEQWRDQVAQYQSLMAACVSDR